MQSTKPQHWLMGIILVLLALIILIYSMHIQYEGSSKPIIENGKIRSERSNEFKRMLMPISDVSNSDVLLDISQNSKKHIKGSVVIPYTDFILGGGLLKSVPEIAGILGKAGISSKDRLVIYGECMACGGGPAPATYIYWMMKCLGHEQIWVLDGTVEDWAVAGGPISSESAIRPSTNYTPNFNSDLFATYEYVKNNKAQIVDARLPGEFEAGSIPGAINIPYDIVLDGHRIKNETGLKSAFINLSKYRPVVVFTDTGVKASVVWFALKLIGYDAVLYTWQNWIDNQPTEDNATYINLTNNNIISSGNNSKAKVNV